MPYLYGDGSPVTLSDPSGLCAADVYGARERSCQATAKAATDSVRSLVEQGMNAWQTVEGPWQRSVQVVPDQGSEAPYISVLSGLDPYHGECRAEVGCVARSATVLQNGATIGEDGSLQWQDQAVAIAIKVACMAPGASSATCRSYSIGSELISIGSGSAESDMTYKQGFLVMLVNWELNSEGLLIPSFIEYVFNEAVVTLPVADWKARSDLAWAAGDSIGPVATLAPAGTTIVTEPTGRCCVTSTGVFAMLNDDPRQQPDVPDRVVHV